MVKRAAKNSISEEDSETDFQKQNSEHKEKDINENPKKRLKTKSLYRQPTVNELNRLQETENLFNSNLFRLQVEEILHEVKVTEKVEKKFQKWYSEFTDHLLSIPEDNNEYDLTEALLTKKLKVKLPISKKLAKTKCIFKFQKFKDIQIVGSYSLDCSINSKLRIDLQITVPADTYTKNDSINYRYHKKRAAYLACIAAHIKDLSIIENLTYTWINASEIKPVLDFSPSGKLNKYFSLRINLVCEDEAYKLHRFSPSRNNLRESWLFSESVESSGVGQPTPYYNSSILCDLTVVENNKFLREVLLRSDNLKQAIVLLKIWLRQRNLQVSGHVICMLVAYLVQTKRINNIMSSYQIVRNVWIALKNSEWDVKGISLYKGDNAPSLEEFHQYFPIVFVDKTGYYNICWQMCKGTYYALRRESALTVDMLDNSNLNSFLPLFMTPVRPLMQFDHILRFKNFKDVKKAVIEKTPMSIQTNYGVDDLVLVTDVLYTLLKKGLGNRVDLILQIVDADFSWSVKKKPDKVMKEEYNQKLSFGLILNSENCLNIVDKGPQANFPEANEFRAFWGDKSELRRFQDGTITEACVWSADSLAERRTVTRQIINYLLNLKYGVPSSELFHVCDQLESLLCRKQLGTQCEESSVEVLRAFDDLRRDMRGLTGLPLDVSAVYGVSPVFSYCEPVPPGPKTALKSWRRGNASLVKEIQRNDGTWSLPEYTPVNKVVVELGHSGKWPGDIEAFRCLKAAFHLQIADQLHKQYSLPTQAYPTYIDVLKNGLVFRLEIAHPKEITLLRKEVENGVAKFRETEESVKLQCDTVLLPRLRGALHGLHQKYPAFGPTACLFKRWLCCHLLSPPHFPPTLAELVVASTFLHPQPLTAAVMPSVGLLRVLALLAEKDWAREMVVLDFNGDMKREELLELESKFSCREDRSPRVHIVTSYDGDLPSVWSSQAPSGHVLARAQALARTALGYITPSLMDLHRDNVLQMFVPSYAGYDVLIHLQPELVPYLPERVDQKPKRLKPPVHTTEAEVIPVVEFHPVMKYLEELRSAYSDFAVFFHDSYGGEVIAVLWKPDIDTFREFQLTNANALQPVTIKGETKYRINKEAIVEDFRLLGDGLVKDIVVT